MQFIDKFMKITKDYIAIYSYYLLICIKYKCILYEDNLMNLDGSK